MILIGKYHHYIKKRPASIGPFNCTFYAVRALPVNVIIMIVIIVLIMIIVITITVIIIIPIIIIIT